MLQQAARRRDSGGLMVVGAGLAELVLARAGLAGWSAARLTRAGTGSGRAGVSAAGASRQAECGREFINLVGVSPDTPKEVFLQRYFGNQIAAIVTGWRRCVATGGGAVVARLRVPSRVGGRPGVPARARRRVPERAGPGGCRKRLDPEGAGKGWMRNSGRKCW